MQNNDGGRPGMNPYMRPMGRSSLLSAPAPLAPVQPAPAQPYTPNEPEEETPAFTRPLIFAEAPKADPAWADEPAELESAAEVPAEDVAEQPAEEQPAEESASRLFVELPEDAADEPVDEESSAEEEMPMVILPVEDEPEVEEDPILELPEEQPVEQPADEPVERMVELPDELPQEMEDEDDESADEPAVQLNPWPEPVDYAAAYAMSRVAPELEQPQVELPQEESVPEMAEDIPEESAAQPEDGEPVYDFDPAYYAAYWQQWQNAMEAHQAATCSACPLLNNQRGKVCYVPVIIPDGSEVDPQAVLTLRNAAIQSEEAAQPAEDDLFPGMEQPQDDLDDIDDGFDDEDEDFTGDDAMADEDMPKPQTVPVGAPEIVEMPKMKKGRKWPWILLALVLLLVGGVFGLSRLGYLQAVVDWLGLPESVVQWLKDITLL